MLSGGSAGGFGVQAPRILIVDDDPSLLVLLADQLRADGFETSTAPCVSLKLPPRCTNRTRNRPHREDEAGVE